MSRRRPPGWSLLAAASVLAAGCSAAGGGGDSTSEGPAPAASSSSSSSAPALPAVRPATEVRRPRAGACYRLAFADAVAATSSRPSVGCRGRHTARTFFVGRLDTVVDGHLLAVDSRAVREQVAAACPARLARFLGGGVEARRLSLLRATWFTPTIEQSADGADWFRCDVVAPVGDGRLVGLSGRLDGVLDRPAARRWALCGTADPAEARFRRVPCSARHSWQAVATVDSPAPPEARFPGRDRLATDGRTACERPARTRATDPLSVTWSYEPPTREQWRAGQRYGICWVPVG